MKKKYITPEAVVCCQVPNIMYQTSILNGGNGDDEEVDAKRTVFDGFEDEEDKDDE